MMIIIVFIIMHKVMTMIITIILTREEMGKKNNKKVINVMMEMIIVMIKIGIEIKIKNMIKWCNENKDKNQHWLFSHYAYNFSFQVKISCIFCVTKCKTKYILLYFIRRSHIFKTCLVCSFLAIYSREKEKKNNVQIRKQVSSPESIFIYQSSCLSKCIWKDNHPFKTQK